MAIGINAFKNSNTTNSLYSNTAEVTRIEHNNGVIAIHMTGMTAGKKVLGFDYACRIVGMKYQTVEAKADHGLSVFNGTSAASNLLALISATADDTTYFPSKFDTANAEIAKGGHLTFNVSGASWAAGNNIQQGILILETIPL